MKVGDLLKRYNKVKYITKAIPLVIIIGAILIFLLYGRDITVEQILNYSPQNQLLAIIFILGIFALKSLSVVFPLIIIYIVSGMIFPPFLAIAINIMGIIIGCSCSYFIGYFSGRDIKEQLILKYPRLNQLDSLLKDNQWFFTYLLRTVGILPLDVASILMGSVGIPYVKYITASVLAMLPVLVTTTFIGLTITNPRSPEFILSILIRIIIFVISILIYRKIIKNKL